MRGGGVGVKQKRNKRVLLVAGSERRLELLLNMVLSSKCSLSLSLSLVRQLLQLLLLTCQNLKKQHKDPKAGSRHGAPRTFLLKQMTPNGLVFVNIIDENNMNSEMLLQMQRVNWDVRLITTLWVKACRLVVFIMHEARELVELLCSPPRVRTCVAASRPARLSWKLDRGKI